MQHASFWALKDGAEIRLPSHWIWYCDFVSYLKSTAFKTRNTTSIWISDRGNGWCLGNWIRSSQNITFELSWFLVCVFYVFTRAGKSNAIQAEELLLLLFNSPQAVKRPCTPLECCWGLLTHPLGVVEVAFHHFTGFAITTADSTAILFGSWANDSIAANFLMTTTRGPHYFVCKVKVTLNIEVKTKIDIWLKTWTGRKHCESGERSFGTALSCLLSNSLL